MHVRWRKEKLWVGSISHREQSSLLFWWGVHRLGTCPLGGDSSLTLVLGWKNLSAKHCDGREKGKYGLFALKITFLWKSVLKNGENNADPPLG